MIKADINNEILRQKIIKLALLQYKKQYIHGSHGPDTFDCAGLVWYVYNRILDIDIYNNGIGLSTTTKIMTNDYGKLNLYNEFSETKEINIINVGDIVLFHRQSKDEYEPKENNKYPGHCGIYLGNNKFIHCTRKKGEVIINNFNQKYWKKVLVASKDIITEINTIKYEKVLYHT